jgi:hypothetical protein
MSIAICKDLKSNSRRRLCCWLAGTGNHNKVVLNGSPSGRGFCILQVEVDALVAAVIKYADNVFKGLLRVCRSFSPRHPRMVFLVRR